MCSVTDFPWERNILVNITYLQPIQFSLPLTFTIFIPFSSSTQMPYLDYASATWLLLECRNASDARTAIPKHFLHGGDNQLPRNSTTPGSQLTTTALAAGGLFFPGNHLLHTHLAGTELGLPGGAVVKNLPDNAGDMGSIPWSGRSPGRGNGNPLQYSCLDNFMDRGVWQATVPGVSKESDKTE